MALQIVEGAATIACALLGALVLPDFPATSKQFTPRQRKIAVDRLTADNITARTEDNPPMSILEAIESSLMDWRTWLLTIGYMVRNLFEMAARDAQAYSPLADRQL